MMENKNEINELREVIKTIKLPDETSKAINDMNVALAEYLLSVTPAFGEFGKSISKTMASIYSNLQVYDFSKIFKGLIDLQKIAYAEDNYYKLLFCTKWTPYLDDDCGLDLAAELINISISEKSDNKKKELTDKVMFRYLDAKKIKSIKQNWNNSELPNYIKRIVKQAIDAYTDRKYALTIYALVFTWEAIIDEKQRTTGNRRGKKLTDKYLTLIGDNYDSKWAKKYVEEYILYNCNGLDEIKDDVPGRHALAHSYIKGYPSKKAALNSIIFTNMLINSRYKTA